MLTDLETALQIARDPLAPLPELARLAGLTVEIDRSLAQHPNASGSLLEILARSKDDLVLRHVTRHPACALSLCEQLGKRYLADFLANPALPNWVAQAPELLRWRDVIGRSDCPDFWLEMCARFGSFAESLAVACNPDGRYARVATRRIRQRQTELTRRIVESARLQHDRVAPDTTFESLRCRTPVFIPKHKVREPDDPLYRLGDQLYAGVPYTCADWPWPESHGQPMRAVAQVNLQTAGRLIGERIGEGLLQCWLGTQGEVELRVLPKPEMLPPPTAAPRGWDRLGHVGGAKDQGTDGPSIRRHRPWIRWCLAGFAYPGLHPPMEAAQHVAKSRTEPRPPSAACNAEYLAATIADLGDDLASVPPTTLGGFRPWWDTSSRSHRAESPARSMPLVRVSDPYDRVAGWSILVEYRIGHGRGPIFDYSVYWGGDY